MRKFVARLIAIGLACSVVAPATPGTAHPFHEGSGCGRWYRKWRTSHQCAFWFHGFPITVYGNAEATGRASVRVWITSPAIEGIDALAECSGSDSRFVSCDDIQPSIQYLVDIQLDEIPLTCHVEGRSKGQYWCASGGGVPLHVPP